MNSLAESHLFRGTSTRRWYTVDYILSDEGFLQVGLVKLWFFVMVFVISIILDSVAIHSFPGAIEGGLWFLFSHFVCWLVARYRRTRIRRLSMKQLKELSSVKEVRWAEIKSFQFRGKMFQKLDLNTVSSKNYSLYTKKGENEIRHWLIKGGLSH